MSKKIFISLLILLIWQCSFLNNAFSESLGAPILKVRDFNGKIFEIDEHKNKAVLVLFWAQWCGYCRREMIELDEIYKIYKDKGLVIIALSIDRKENEEKVVNFANKLSYPSAFYSDAKTNFLNRKNTVPQIQIVDKKRSIIYSLTGYVEKKEIIKAIDKALF